MKILDKELEFNFNDADDMERFENAIEKAQKNLDSIETKGKKTSEIIREVCKYIYNCFDEVFGQDASKKIFDNKYNLNTCIEAFKNLGQARVDQEKVLEKELKDFETKYSPNRVARGTKK